MILEQKGLIKDQSNKTSSQAYDTRTGEVEEGALVWVPKRPRSLFGRNWYQMAQQTLEIINKNRRFLGAEGLVVFNALMTRLDFENYIQISQSEIANELEMQRSNVSRAMKRLIELGVIRPGPKVGRSLTYQLHPDLAWKGKSKTHHRAREEARKAGWEIIEGGSGSGKERNEDKDQMSLPF